MTGGRSPVRIEPGAVLVVDQDDYCYGTGKLRLRVPRGGVVPAGVEWLPVAGTEIGGDGRARGERYALVRADAIPKALAAGREWAGRELAGHEHAGRPPSLALTG